MNQKHIDYLRGLYYENNCDIDAMCDAVGLDCDGHLQGISDELFRMGAREALKELERDKYYVIEYLGKYLKWNFERDGKGNKIYEIIDKLPNERHCAFADTETTGLPIISNGVAINDGRQPNIIEWACYTPGARHEWDVTLVDPQCYVPDDIQKLTGISQNDVKNKGIYLYNIDIEEIIRKRDYFIYFYPDKPVEQKHRARADVELIYAVYKAVKEKEEKNLTSSEG